MDIIDNASTLEDLHREAALSMHRLNRNLVSAEKCSECDEPIKKDRRDAYPGCTMCVDCQADAEKRNRRM
ncbi:TraR/DksA family transcriptional regulator [Citrobacter freundii]|uniref:TraR/DksA family transcriptional regulator n=1 Tax=Citrobacter freundii TaxID=546 RepID=UPI001495F635|nr:TraR/DksA family transcriptional regulator [Citrobacter freundii]